ncbi:hypothetical protein LQ956_07355 [Ectothiorhodospira sp. A-7Y]|nr:hypothetical protein [Ectothiorhodospira lacustris]MCG5510080.1 hypothetical protein [Ectothiorhodospira lacustris]MCG5521826.1 hypothetical protein [Ectothiorhodospira lacustris]
MLPFLDKARLVQDQNTFRGAQRIDDPLAENITCRIRISAGTIQQVLHPIWGFISEPFGEVPAILSFALTEQALNVT